MGEFGWPPGFPKFRVLIESRFLHLLGNFVLGKFDGMAIDLLDQFESLKQPMLDRAIANLLRNTRAISFVDFEGIVVLVQMISCLPALPVLIGCRPMGRLL